MGQGDADRNARSRCRKVITFYGANELVFEALERRMFLPYMKSGKFDGFDKVFNLTFIAEVVSRLPVQFIKDFVALLGEDPEQNIKVVKALRRYMEIDPFLKIVKVKKISPDDALAKIKKVIMNLEDKLIQYLS
jgi:hypothetical protein